MKVIITESQYQKLKEKHFNNNQKRLREYVKLLKTNYNDGFIDEYNKFDIMITYFTIIHNFLFLENMFKTEVEINNKNLNKYLDLPKIENVNIVEELFKNLYDTNSPVRFAVETFDSIENIRQFLESNPNLYKKIFYKL